MMRQLGITMTVRANTDDVKKRLAENLEKHAAMVEEARKNYLVQARKELERRLSQLQEGLLKSVTVNLRVPEDYSYIYRTAIGLLAMHTESQIELGVDEYRKLMEDEWEWTAQFVGANAGYSPSVREYGATKGIDL